MKIAIGILKLLPRGGLEDHAIRLAEALAGRGHEVVLHTTGKLPDMSVAAVSLDRPAKALTNHGRVAAFSIDFGKATSGHFDRMVGFQPMPGLDILFLADHLRDRPDASLLKRLTPRFRGYARLEAACFGPASRTRIMGLARPQLQAFVERYPKAAARMAILPPTITEERRRPHLRTPELRAAMRTQFGIDADAPVWLWLGLQPRIKGLDRVIEALARVPAAVLLVGGVAQDDAKLGALVRRTVQLGVSHRIRWLGYLSGDDVASHFVAADLLAHPARVDVTGAVILEAVINGLPVVATDCCGFAPHIERSGAGRVILTPFDAEAFAAALVEVGGPENAILSANGIEYGQSPQLYSGLAVACDLIEAAAWPRQITMAEDADRPRMPAAQAGRQTWSH